MSINRVYILGAGASIDCGIPTIAYMPKSIENEYRLSTLTEAYYSDEKEQQDAYPSRKKMADEYKIIIDSAKKHEIEDFDLLFNNLPTNKQDLIRKLYFWYFWDRRNHSARNPEGKIESSRALQLLQKTLNIHNDKVISFNYDIMFEEAITFIKNEKFKYHYGFTGNKSGKIEIVKPMGSINWLILDKEQKIHYRKFFKGHWVPQVDTVKNSEILRPIIDLDDKSTLYETIMYSEDFEKIVYRPSIYGSDILRNDWPQMGDILWDNAIKYINMAQEIVLIGFNPDKIDKSGTSEKINNFIKNIFNSKKIISVNPDEKVNGYIKSKLQSGCEYNPINKRFGEWISEEHEKSISKQDKKEAVADVDQKGVSSSTVAASGTNYTGPYSISISGDNPNLGSISASGTCATWPKKPNL